MMKLLGNLRVRLTAETEDFARGLAAAKQRLGTFEKDILRFRKNTLANLFALGTLTAGLKTSMDAANKYDNAQRQLAATAKLTGTEFGFLQSVAKGAEGQFKLSAVSANAFTIELTKLAQKAGNVGQASAGLQAFLDIGAARGLDAAQTLKAVQQSILGIDEGTDKLFSKNPSVLYEEFAAKIGTTAGKLTDAQKAQALLNAALEDGAKVRGEYQKWLQSAAGQQFLLSQGIEKTQAALGRALQPALVAILPTLTKLVEWLQAGIRAVQTLGASLAFIPAAFNAARLAISGNLQQALAELEHQTAAFKEVFREIWTPADAAAPSFTLPTPNIEDVKRDGKRTATSFFDGLKEEWENLRYAIALRGLGIDGNEQQRLSLEEEHALRLLDIERERLEARYKMGDLSREELDQGLEEIRIRRDIARTRRQEFAAIEEHLRKQGNIKNLIGSVTSLLPSKGSSKGADIGANAATVINDKFDLSGKLATKVGGGIGQMLGGLAGSAILPGIGSLLGSKIGGLFGKKEKQENPIVRQLEAIERAQKDTITTIEGQTNALLKPESRFLNLPSTFNAPSYNPGQAVGTTNVTYGDTNIKMEFNVSTQHNPEDIKKLARDGVAEALRREMATHTRSKLRLA